MWAYESHLGGIYFESKRKSPNDLYCSQCDDFDWELGNFESAVKFLECYAPRISASDDDFGIYPLKGVLRALNLYFDDVPDYDKAVEIVRANGEVEYELTGSFVTYATKR